MKEKWDASRLRSIEAVECVEGAGSMFAIDGRIG